MEKIPKGMPIILLCNHQSAVVDALLTGSLFSRRVYFLARGETFNTKFKRWFLRQVNLIPVYRPEVTPGEEWRNKSTISRCFELFNENRVIITYPEAVSETEPRIRPLRTGMARIALSYGSANKFQKELAVVPLAINYEDSHAFRSEVLIKVSTPILISAYQKMYAENKAQAVADITDKVKVFLEENTLVIPSREEEKIITDAAEIAGYQKKNITNNFALIKKTYDVFNHEIPEHLRRSIPAFTDVIDKAGLKLKNFAYFAGMTTPVFIRDLFIFIVTFPLLFCGIVVFGIPYFASRWMTHKFTKRPDFMGTIALICGTFVCFVYGVILSFIIYKTGWHYMALLFLITYPFTFVFIHWIFILPRMYAGFYRLNKASGIEKLRTDFYALQKEIRNRVNSYKGL